MAILKYNSAKRFGSRYGRTVRHKLAKIEKLQKATYKCPRCNYQAAKREAAGIWKCRKCGTKFTAKAYTV